MAKIQTETVVLTFNRLVKESDEGQESIVTSDTAAALEQVAQELAGAGIIVEIDVVK